MTFFAAGVISAYALLLIVLWVDEQRLAKRRIW